MFAPAPILTPDAIITPSPITALGPISTSGDRLEMETYMTKIKGPIAKCDARAFVDGKLCVEAEITIALK